MAAHALKKSTGGQRIMVGAGCYFRKELWARTIVEQ